MKQLPVRHEPQSLVKPVARRAPAAETPWDRLAAALAEPNLFTVAAFCAIGLLIALNLILRFPEFGAVIQQYNQF
jgi:hypothetical protein